MIPESSAILLNEVDWVDWARYWMNQYPFQLQIPRPDSYPCVATLLNYDSFAENTPSVQYRYAQ